MTERPDVDVDELDDHIAESMKDPAYRAAFNDVTTRHAIIDGLLARRRELGLTQTDVATTMGVRQGWISEFESEGSDPRLSTIQRYARAVNARIVVSLALESEADR